MEPLFKSITKYTFEEYKKFNIALFKKTAALKVVIVFEFLIILISYLLNSLPLLLLAILYPIIFYFIQKLSIKRIYESNKVMQDMDVEFNFYDDYFDAIYENGKAKIEYKMLYKVIETKTNFYLMIGKNQGYILTKDNVSKELSEFIHTKLMK